MSKIPGYIDASTNADRYVRTVTGRVTVGQYQFILDLAINWEVDRSAVIRAIINYAAEMMPETAEGYGEPLDERACATAAFVTARRLAREQESVRDGICQAYHRAMSMSNGSAKEALLKAAERYAKAHGVKWPPVMSDVNPVRHDPDLRYIYDRILRLVAESEVSRISIRDLAVSTGKDKQYLVQQLNQLNQLGHILLSEEQRSGRLTVWIEVSTMQSRH